MFNRAVKMYFSNTWILLFAFSDPKGYWEIDFIFNTI